MGDALLGGAGVGPLGGSAASTILPSTVAALPAPSTVAREERFVVDASWPGPCVVISDGTNWIREDNLEIVRAHAAVETVSLDFNGTTQYAIQRASQPPNWVRRYIEFDVPWSWEILFRPTAAQTGELFACMDNSGIGWLLEYLSSGALRLFLRNGGANQLSVDTSTTVCSTLNTWYHVAGSYDGVNASGVAMAVDGVGQTMTINTDALSASIASANADFCLGARQPAGILFFKGQIQRMRMWAGVIPSATQLALCSSVDPFLPLPGTPLMVYRCGNDVDANVSNPNPIHNWGPPGRLLPITTTTNTDTSQHLLTSASVVAIAP